MLKIFSGFPLLFILFIFVRCCQTQIDTIGCKFYVNSSDSSCQAFTFQKCQWRVCTSRIRVNNISRCINYQTITKNSWGECMDHCCSNTGLQTYGTLQECTDINEKNKMILLYILVSILGSGAMIFLIFCCCRCAANKDESFANETALRCRRTASVGPMEAVSRNILSDKIKSKTHLKLCQRQKEQKQKGRKLNEICSICLDDLPNAELQCNHTFHQSCIIEWVKRNNHCPNCRIECKIITINSNKCCRRKTNFSLQSRKTNPFISNFECEHRVNQNN